MTHCGSKKIFEITLDEDIRDIHTYTHMHTQGKGYASSSDMVTALFQDRHFFLSPVPKERV